MVRREYLIARSYRLAVAFGALFGFLNVALYFYISRTVVSRHGVDLEGAPDYFNFAAVGVAIGLVLQIAGASLATRVRDEQLTGTLEALVAQPISATEIALGLVGFPFLFGFVRVALYLVVAGAVGLQTGNADWAGVALVLLATAFALTGIGIVLASAVLLVKRATAVAGLATFLVSFLSGAYFPISVFPGALQWIAKLSPVRFAFDGLRAALFSGGGWGSDAASLALVGVIAMPVSLAVFAGALRLNRIRGSLSEY